MKTLERRTFAADSLEIRAEGDGQPAIMAGYVVRFNDLSKDLGGFRERITPGAFDEVLAGDTDIRALFEHDKQKLLGRRSNKTLGLTTDSRGLKFELTLPETSYATDLRTQVQRGDINGMSFGFRGAETADRFLEENGEVVRELQTIALREITITSVPAYEGTELSLRVDPEALERAKAMHQPKLRMKRHALRRAEAAD